MAESRFKAIIVGGGPAGLTAAHALHLAGIDFVVLERRDTVVNDAGASLVLGAHSLRVMHQFGLLDRLLAIGGELRHTKSFTVEGHKFADSTGIRLSRENFGTAPVAFHRAQLIQTIYDGLPEEAKKKYLFNQSIASIVSEDDGVKVTCANGAVYEGSIVIGADGVHSKTRRLMRELALKADPTADWDAETPFVSTYKCLWCSFPRPSEPGEGFDTQHKDRSIMYLTGQDRGYIFLYQKLPEASQQRQDYTDKDVEEFAMGFADWPITETLKVKDVWPQKITAGMANLEEGILKRWHWGRIVLVGDACHKFTPNAGLGFNNGIQDVVALCNKLHNALVAAEGRQLDMATLEPLLESYQSMRISSLKGDLTVSAGMTRMQAWSSNLTYLLARYVMPLDFVQKMLFNHLLARTMKEALILEYVSTDERIKGRIPWVHEMK